MRSSRRCNAGRTLVVSLTLLASLHCTAEGQTWSIIAVVVAGGNLQEAGEDYARRLMTAGESAGWSVAVELDNGTDSPLRLLAGAGQAQVVQSPGGPRVSLATRVGLTDFFRWAREKAPADHYAVVVYGHGVSASGRGWDGIPTGSWPMLGIDAGGNDPLEPWELAAGIDEGLEQRADVLVLDSCYGASLELAWDLRRCADVIIASPGRLPIRGAPWERILEQTTGLETPEDLGRMWAQRAEGTVAVRTVGLELLADRLRLLSLAMAGDIGEHAPLLTRARSQSATWGAENEMVDLHTFSTALVQSCSGEAGVAASNTLSALELCRLSERGAVTVPFPSALTGGEERVRAGGFDSVSGWADLRRAYRARQQYLMRRTLSNPRHGGAAI